MWAGAAVETGRLERSRAVAQPAQRLQQVVGDGGHESLAVYPRFLEGRLFHNPLAAISPTPVGLMMRIFPRQPPDAGSSPAGRLESDSFPGPGGAAGNRWSAPDTGVSDWVAGTLPSPDKPGSPSVAPRTGSCRSGGDRRPASAPCPGDRPDGLPGTRNPLSRPCWILAWDGWAYRR